MTKEQRKEIAHLICLKRGDIFDCAETEWDSNVVEFRYSIDLSEVSERDYHPVTIFEDGSYYEGYNFDEKENDINLLKIVLPMLKTMTKDVEKLLIGGRDVQ